VWACIGSRAQKGWWSQLNARCLSVWNTCLVVGLCGSESSVIELLEGVPGSGKSYYAVSARRLKWVRAGRRVYVYVEGFYLDRLALFEGSSWRCWKHKLRSGIPVRT